MSDIEKYMIELRDSLDGDEPKAGHAERFSRLMKGKGKKERKINIRHALQIAASVAIILTSGVLIIKSGKGSGKMAHNQVVEEFQETSSFYTRQVNQRYRDISALDFNSGTEKEMLLKELSEMDVYYQELLRELDAKPGEEQVINALINHYQIKIQVMDQIIDQLIQIQNNNTPDDEKNTI